MIVIFPSDMRETCLTRGQMMRISLRLQARGYVRFALVLMALIVIFNGQQLSSYVLERSAAPDWNELIFQLCSAGCVWIGWLLVLWWSTWRGIRRNKNLGVPIRYGFDADGVYSSSRWGKTFLYWETFRAWKEYGSHILLDTGTQCVILPKALWNDTELAELRDYLQRGAESASMASLGYELA